MDVQEDKIGNIVVEGYKKILKRYPDPIGLKNYIREIKNGLSIEEFYEILITSEEYVDNKNKIYKNKIYNNEIYNNEIEDHEIEDHEIEDHEKLEEKLEYGDIFKIFDKELIKNVGISWFDVEKIYRELGNAPGTYPDTLLLFFKIINNHDIKKVIEVGAGVSTLYLSKICKDKDIEFKSYEEMQIYLEKTRNLLGHYGLNPNSVKLLANIDDIDYNTDILFIDCSIDMRCKLLRSNRLDNISIIMVDDSENGELSRCCSKFMCDSKRYLFYIYEGTGRKDRHIFINYIEGIGDIKDFIDKDMICIVR